MLSDSFQVILEVVNKKSNIECVKLNNLLEYIQTKPIKSLIFPEIASKKCDLSEKEIVKVFIYLEKLGVLKQVYKLYCPNCKDISQDIFENFNELEEQSVCEECGKDLYDSDNPYKYIFINFEVIRNE